MNVLGIDPSSKTLACAWLSDELGLITHKYVVKRTRRDQEITGLIAQIEHPAYWLAYEAFIEEPVVAGARNLRSTILIAETVGAVMAATTCPITLIPVTSWKKGTVGRGNATKDEVAEWLKHVYPSYSAQCEGDQDLVDAVCIGLYGRKLIHDSVGRDQSMD